MLRKILNALILPLDPATHPGPKPRVTPNDMLLAQSQGPWNRRARRIDGHDPNRRGLYPQFQHPDVPNTHRCPECGRWLIAYHGQIWRCTCGTHQQVLGARRHFWRDPSD